MCARWIRRSNMHDRHVKLVDDGLRPVAKCGTPFARTSRPLRRRQRICPRLHAGMLSCEEMASRELCQTKCVGALPTLGSRHGRSEPIPIFQQIAGGHRFCCDDVRAGHAEPGKPGLDRGVGLIELHADQRDAGGDIHDRRGVDSTARVSKIGVTTSTSIMACSLPSVASSRRPALTLLRPSLMTDRKSRRLVV